MYKAIKIKPWISQEREYCIELLYIQGNQSDVLIYVPNLIYHSTILSYIMYIKFFTILIHVRRMEIPSTVSTYIVKTKNGRLAWSQIIIFCKLPGFLEFRKKENVIASMIYCFFRRQLCRPRFLKTRSRNSVSFAFKILTFLIFWLDKETRIYDY